MKNALTWVITSDHFTHMDVDWFKKLQKQKGVTSADLGEAISRDRTVISRIYHNRQKMSLDQAKVFSDLLEAPLQEVLVRAGLADAETALGFQPGFTDSDAAPWIERDAKTSTTKAIAAILGSERKGVDVWRVTSSACNLAGLLPGDFLLIDSHARDAAKANDIVIAQVYDWQTGGAKSILRRYQPPMLVPNSTDQAHLEAFLVDNNNVVITGRVIASWRH